MQATASLTDHLETLQHRGREAGEEREEGGGRREERQEEAGHLAGLVLGIFAQVREDPEIVAAHLLSARDTSARPVCVCAHARLGRGRRGAERRTGNGSASTHFVMSPYFTP